MPSSQGTTFSLMYNFLSRMIHLRIVRVEIVCTRYHDKKRNRVSSPLGFRQQLMVLII